MCCPNSSIVFTVCIPFIVRNTITWSMLLALYACTNNYLKTTRYQGPFAQKFEGEERASPRIKFKSHLSCREGHPEGSKVFFVQIKENLHLFLAESCGSGSGYSCWLTQRQLIDVPFLTVFEPVFACCSFGY